MRNTRWIVWGLLSATAVVGILALSIYLYHRPLGPSLELKWPADVAAEQNTGRVALQNSTRTLQVAEATTTKEGVCGQTGNVNMLMLGRSSPESAPRGTDAIRLMVVDYNAPSVAILSMPPDLWVETTALEDVDATTLTMAFGYAESRQQGEPASVRKATQVVAQALLDNFGYETVKYLTLDQPEFKDMIDTLDGVQVNVLEYVDGTPEGFGIYEPGLQLMGGQRALDYIRIRQPADQEPNEWSRFSRQNQVIKGIRNDLLKPKNLIQIPTIIHDFYHLVATNLSLKELQVLNCMFDKVDGQSTLLQLTPDMVTIQPDGVMIPDVEAIRALIEELYLPQF